MKQMLRLVQLVYIRIHCVCQGSAPWQLSFQQLIMSFSYTSFEVV